MVESAANRRMDTIRCALSATVSASVLRDTSVGYYREHDVVCCRQRNDGQNPSSADVAVRWRRWGAADVGHAHEYRDGLPRRQLQRLRSGRARRLVDVQMAVG